MRLVVLAGLMVTSTLGTACRSTQERRPAPPELEGWWRLYGTRDAGWPAAREEWLARGDKAREVLILNLLVDMESGAGGGWLRPLEELEVIGPSVLPYALAALQARRHDAVARDRCRELVGRVADEATLERAYREAKENDDLRVEIVGAAARCKRPGCADLLARVLSDDPLWEARARAAEGLAIRDVSAESAVARAVIDSLQDKDLFVARKAAETLVAWRLEAAARPLLALLERAHREGDDSTMRLVFEGLRTVTHHPEIGDDVGAWHALLDRR